MVAVRAGVPHALFEPDPRRWACSCATSCATALGFGLFCAVRRLSAHGHSRDVEAIFDFRAAQIRRCLTREAVAVTGSLYWPGLLLGPAMLRLRRARRRRGSRPAGCPGAHHPIIISGTTWSGPTMTSARVVIPPGAKYVAEGPLWGGSPSFGVGQHLDRHAERLVKRDAAVGRVDQDPVERGALRGELLEHLFEDLELIGADRAKASG